MMPRHRASFGFRNQSRAAKARFSNTSTDFSTEVAISTVFQMPQCLQDVEVFEGELELCDDERSADWSNTLRIFAKLLMVLAAVAFIGTALYKFDLLKTKHVNQMILGSKSPVTREYPLKLRTAIELDGKSPKDILSIRQREVARHDQLISPGYSPNPTVFGDIGKTDQWIGTLGKYGYGPGTHAAEGPSESSRLLLNPLLLVGADIWPVDPSMNRLRISPNKFGSATLSRYRIGETRLPFFCEPQRMVWEPQRRRATVTYDVGSFLSDRKGADRKQPMLTTMAQVDFNMLNARDLNFKYCFTSPKFIKNVKVLHAGSGKPSELSDRFTVGALAGPNQTSLLANTASWPKGKFLLTGEYPASVEFLMWRNSPEPDTAPDVRFTVRFENSLKISPEARAWVNYFRGSQDALCVAGMALAELAKDPQKNTAARDRAMLASQRLEDLGKTQKSLPTLNREIENEVKRYVTGKELKIGYAVFSRSAGVTRRLGNTPGLESLIAEYRKPHWSALHGLANR